MRSVRLAVLALLAALTLLAALLLATPAPAQAQVSFGPAASVAVGDGPASTAVGDFNGDGNPRSGGRQPAVEHCLGAGG